MTIAVRPASRRRRPLLDAHLGVQVDVRGGLVEHEDPRVGDHRARERDELALSGGERDAALADLGVVAVLERRDEVVRADRARRRLDLCGARVGPAERDVGADRAREQERLLRHDPQLRAQRREGHVADVVPVDQHAPGGRVVEARDELREGRLAGAGRADERDGLAGGDPQIDVVEREPRGAAVALRVGEADVVEDAARRGSARAPRRPGARPCPAARRAARRSCRAPPCPPGRSCRAARAG